MANGRTSPHLELNYGITGSGPSTVLQAVPTLAVVLVVLVAVALLDRLRGQPQWRTLLDRQGIVLLERIGH